MREKNNTNLERMRELIERLTEADIAYYKNDAPIMTDLEYDRLTEELASLEHDTGLVLSGSPTQKVSGEILENLAEVRHTKPMLSAGKTKSIEDLIRFAAGRAVLLSWKMDGLTLVLRYEYGKLKQAITRGREGISVFDVYCDDDVSGTDFQRPEFSRMMNDIRDGKVNCVIVKDLSRLGRNHLESGEFIEMVFPYLNVRFISITDRFDSLYKQADISVQIKNLLNERYAKDVSKKICSVMESMQKQGKYVGSKAPYGYLRDPMDKHHLVIDPEAAPIVRELFEMVAEGCTLHYAAVTMNDRGIPSPGRHNFNLGLVKSDKFKNSLWYQQTVRKILIDRTYLGWTIGGKYRSDFYSSGEKKSKAVPKEDWIITKGTHEPIVSEGLFDCVQKYFDDLKHTAGAATKYNCKSKQASIFKGHLRCGECGKAMFLRAKKNNGKTTWWYYCTLHENYNSSYCPKKAVKKEELESSVLRLIKVQMQLFTDAQAIVASLNQREKNKSRYRIFQEQIRSVMARIDLYGERKATLYRSFKEGILSEQEYIAEANACATKADELRIFAHELEKEAQKYSPEYKGSTYWTELIKEYGNRTELDAAMVDALIDEVVLFNDGHYEVKLKYRDEMEELLLNAALWQKEAQRYA